MIFILILIFVSMVHAVDYSYLKNLHTLTTIKGKTVFMKCPEWDWSLIPKECRSSVMISFNCLPRCGKYPGDKPDIGAYEYFPGITDEKPWGNWNGIPLQKKPFGIKSPRGFRIK